MTYKKLDIKANRASRPYSHSEYIRRILWSFGSLFFKLTPRTCFRLRCSILRLFGAQIGEKVHIYPSARIYLPWKLKIGAQSSIGENVLIYNLGMVEIGDKSTVSHGAHICAGTHDYNDPKLPLMRDQISIGSYVWICSDAFISPSVEINDYAIVGARAVVTKSVTSGHVVVGNPAKFIKHRFISEK